MLEAVQHLDGYCIGGVHSCLLEVISCFAIAHDTCPQAIQSGLFCYFCCMDSKYFVIFSSRTLPKSRSNSISWKIGPQIGIVFEPCAGRRSSAPNMMVFRT